MRPYVLLSQILVLYPRPLSPTYAMEKTFEAIEAELGYTGS